ncbi:hypothetical protein [Gloeobacter morelensis]|uniref:Uncharacterized protein n=1 Tax=Gloeobacter morelensis MG652769 TaxID=2781736 RepID=A0ABY3PHC9_9CYAN|nr:hypothetical protein [Gloeobacter morelensis]UFP93023.1 hypothetical protein ISF26_14515 [Gloeobacter morelensis MG652769]
MRSKRLSVCLEDPEDVRSWLSVIFKADVLMSLADPAAPGQPSLSVALCLTLRPHPSMLHILSSELLQAARRGLGIERHWLLVLDERCLPGPWDLLEAFYHCADAGGECEGIDFGPLRSLPLSGGI